jgi:hypothetical protein
MLTRRNVLAAAPLAIGGRLIAPLEVLAIGSGFIMLTDDGEHMTNEMPAAETVVEVVLTDGSIGRAWYDHNIMESGDWEFVALRAGETEPSEDASSISHLVAGWRPLAFTS